LDGSSFLVDGGGMSLKNTRVLVIGGSSGIEHLVFTAGESLARTHTSSSRSSAPASR
jgi:hypothetical protein